MGRWGGGALINDCRQQFTDTWISGDDAAHVAADLPPPQCVNDMPSDVTLSAKHERKNEQKDFASDSNCYQNSLNYFSFIIGCDFSDSLLCLLDC